MFHLASGGRVGVGGWTWLALVLVLAAGSVRAQGVEQPGAYSVIASTCTIDEHDLPRAAIGGTDFTFRAAQLSRRNASGDLVPIVARCPVVDVSGTGQPDWNTLIVGYQDPDGGAGEQHRVRVRLIRVSRPTGVRGIALFDSQFSGQGAQRTEHAAPFEEALDFQRFSYFLELRLSRGDRRGPPRVWHLRLATVR